MSSICKPLKHIRYFVEKVLPTLQKWWCMINIMLKKRKTPIREKGKKYLLLVRKKETDNKKLVE